jgi:hypothetical protein
MGYSSDRAWSDKFIPTIKKIVGPHMLEVSPLEVDRKQAADLIVLSNRSMTIACRVRRPGYVDLFRYDFTIRAERDNGASTELEKITNGWGDCMFYGHAADKTGIELVTWLLIDLRAWRAHCIRNRKSIVSKPNSNGDGTHFLAFDIRSFVGDPSILIASSFQSIPWFVAPERQTAAATVGRVESIRSDAAFRDGLIVQADLFETK